MNAQGEDVVAGIRTGRPISDLEAIMPDAYRQLRDITTSLEKHYRDMQDFEFTIEDGKLYMLQTRNGKRTGPAAVRVAVEMVKEGLIDKKEAVLRVAPQQLDQLLHPVFDPASLKTLTKIANGIDASPGAAVGRAVFAADEAVEMREKRSGDPGPQRNHARRHSRHGSSGGSSHRDRRQVEPRGRGRARHGTALRGRSGRALHIEEHKKQFTVKVGGKDVVVKEGDWISLDGTTGDVYLGQAKTKEPDPKSPLFVEFMEWADEFRGDFGVRANADIPRDAKVAREFGAEGIGLCRTEHMFFAEDRIPHMQAMILADDEKTRDKALAETAAHAAQGFRRPVRSHGRLTRWSSARSIRRCTSSCPSART